MVICIILLALEYICEQKQHSKPTFSALELSISREEVENAATASTYYWEFQQAMGCVG